MLPGVKTACTLPVVKGTSVLQGVIKVILLLPVVM